METCPVCGTVAPAFLMKVKMKNKNKKVNKQLLRKVLMRIKKYENQRKKYPKVSRITLAKEINR